MASKIKVDNIENQCGGAVVTKCGATTTISGSVVKADDIQAADGGNIINQCGTTITLGASGDTINLASGASQSGFGRTGTVDWQTSSIKTSTFTAANGEGYFANTSGGAFTMNLPAGTAGNIVSVVDYTNTFQTNSLTVAPNGSQKIGGVAAPNTLTTEGQSVTFVYVDDTEGWKNVQDSTSNVTGSPFLIASGGTETTVGNCKIHTFTGPGTFTVSSASTNCASENIVSYLIIGGGGGGGGLGGAGGAGGYREVKNPITPYTASPLDGYGTPGNRVTVTAQAYSIVVGGGGAGQGYNSASPGGGNVSSFGGITAAKGGGGGSGINFPNGEPGGSGGGANGGYNPSTGGTGNTPPVSPPQGSTGGDAVAPNGYGGGGGGGAGGGGSTNPGSQQGGPGGAGTTSSINNTPTTRAGGGGGAGTANPGGGGSAGSGGAGSGTPPSTPTAPAATANTGSGGGAGPGAGGNGGSGIVIIRYKFQ
jgi:hypothetical protein